MTEKLSSMLDAVADSLESKGLVKESAALDVLSNTIERSGFNMPRMSQPSPAVAKPALRRLSPQETPEDIKRLFKRGYNYVLDQGNGVYTVDLDVNAKGYFRNQDLQDIARHPHFEVLMWGPGYLAARFNRGSPPPA